jgi:hypothetical protein
MPHDTPCIFTDVEVHLFCFFSCFFLSVANQPFFSIR